MGQIKINFDYLPENPHYSYEQKGWKGWRNFYGNEWLSFEKARIFAKNLKLKSKTEWYKYYKSENEPNDIPSRPDQIYKNKWISWGDFLGTENVYYGNVNFLSFEEARIFVIKLELKSQREWFRYCKLREKPKNIPSYPNESYKDKGWISWGNFLGTGNVHKKDFLSFKEAREFARKLRLKNSKEWFKYCKSGEKPKNIPSYPNEIYKDKWQGMGDFLGTGSVRKKDFLSFEEARKFAKNLKLKNMREWFRYCKSGNKPKNIPYSPDQVYKDKWTNWYDFLGTKK